MSRRSSRDVSPGDVLDVSPMEAELPASLRAARDVSPGPGRDTSLAQARRCVWCDGPLVDPRQIYCTKLCRQTAWRARKLGVAAAATTVSKRLSYADPPYPGTARKYYRNESTYAGEVDHEALIASLKYSDGWALSTSARALRTLLPLCPPTIRVCAWVKANHVHPATRGPHNLWEALIVSPARLLSPGVSDYLYAAPARGGGELPGRKPLAFCAWLFRLLGAEAHDTFDDVFPGSGVVSRAWRQFSGDAP